MRRSRRKVGNRGYTAPAIPNDHVSKLKLVRVFPERPTSRLNEASRFDFDEALLPGDIWEGDLDADGFVVDKIIDVRSEEDEIWPITQVVPGTMEEVQLSNLDRRS